MSTLFHHTVLPICAAISLALSIPMADAAPPRKADRSAKTSSTRAAPSASNRTATTGARANTSTRSTTGTRSTRASGGDTRAVSGSNNNINIDNSRTVNVNANGDGCHNCGGWDDDDWDVGRAMVTTAAVVGTAAVIGSMVNSVPASCVPVNYNGIVYQQCGATWYQPQYVGSNVNYVVINAPY
ncbi:hypothetical protein [Chitinibacter sp. S2-10]|uniref:hypothetical protein n=1 Tax=Chitinibacter sp. S2-10 TaxID=3373597 RepID=UPI0039773BB4